MKTFTYTVCLHKCFLLLFIFTGLSVAQVSESWSIRYNGPGSSTDKSNAIAVDHLGNVFITGTSPSVGFGTEDYATIKYDSAGVEQWVARYNGTGSSVDNAYALAVDEGGFIYVTGGSTGTGSGFDFLTIKYSTTGDTLWTRRYNGPRNSRDVAYAIAIDDSGNVYVTGESEGSTGTHGIFEDYATIKYTPDGVRRWVVRYNGPAGDYDKANSVDVDTSGNVYVTGVSDGGSSGSGSPYFDYATIKYNNVGTLQWIRRHNGDNALDEAKFVRVDYSENVVVTGSSKYSGSSDDYFTIKYSPTGDTLWLSRYNGTGNNIDIANSLVVDELGNTFVTGKSYGGSSNNYDLVTIKYDSDGDSVWVKRYNGEASGIDEGVGLAVDGSGSVYVAGHSSGITTASDYTTIKYSDIGAEEWIIRYSNSGAAGSGEQLTGIFIDEYSNVYVTGMSALDYATVKYVVIIPVELVSFSASVVNNKVNLFWSTVTETNNSGFQIERSSGSEFQVVGFVAGHGTTTEIQNYAFTDDNVNTGKYNYRLKQMDLDGTFEYLEVVEVEIAAPDKFELSQNYPNPFNPSTVISYQLPVASKVTLKAFDILGNEIATLVNEEKPAGVYEVEFNASHLSSGVYFSKLQANDFVQIKKMILMR